MDPDDLASLLEREPRQGTMSVTEVGQRIHGEIAARVAGNQRDALVASQAARIKSLEDALVAIRTKAQAAIKYGIGPDCNAPAEACHEISSLIGETLDPCKPWCVLAEEGRKHQGACISDEEVDREP